MRIELRLSRRGGGRRGGRAPGIFRVNRRRRRASRVLRQAWRRECGCLRRRGMLPLVVTAHTEGGEPLKQGAAAGLGRILGLHLAALDAHLLLNWER